MIIIRKRLVFWLIKAYIKKMGKSIFLYFAAGLLIFFLFRGFLNLTLSKYHAYTVETIGMVGSYTIDNLPQPILYRISDGLTKVGDDGTPKPDLASSWKITDKGKTYIFTIKKGIKFSDNTLLTANNINYQFSGVKIEKPDKYTIVFKLKEPYSPFLVTVSRPIFKKGFVGVGEYKVKKINLNGDFVESIDLISISSPKKIVYQFYPTYSSLKTAFVMSDVTKALDLPDILYKNKSFSQFKNSNVAKNVNTKQLVTLFYNTKDKVFSSKTLREVFHYTIPDKFSEGERSYGPYPRFSFVFQEGISNYTQDLEHAKLLKDKFLTESPKTKLSFTLYALPKYQETAKNLAGIWEKIGIKVTIKTSDNVPNNFQMFLGEFFPSSDPDQYVLWHTDQSNNITGYSNLRIDKILEDGRQTSDISARKKIYSDFQKYIALDPPASFLFFPYSYDVERK